MAPTSIKATINSLFQSTFISGILSFCIGWYLFCWWEANHAKNARAVNAATKPCKTFRGLTPSIHIIVVVVSPTTLPLPPALLAATIAAIKPMWTLFLKTTRSYRTSYKGSGYVIKERWYDAYKNQQKKRSSPITWKIFWKDIRKAGFFEYLRQNGKSQ